MCHSIAKIFRPNSLTAVSYCTPMPDSSAWGSVWVIWMRRFLRFGLSIRVSTSRWMYLKWLSYNSLNVGHWSRWLSAALFTASMGGLWYVGRLELTHLPLLEQTHFSILMKMIPCLSSFHSMYVLSNVNCLNILQTLICLLTCIWYSSLVYLIGKDCTYMVNPWTG
jgi:hypothetical protein